MPAVVRFQRLRHYGRQQVRAVAQRDQRAPEVTHGRAAEAPPEVSRRAAIVGGRDDRGQLNRGVPQRSKNGGDSVATAEDRNACRDSHPHSTVRVLARLRG